MTKNLGWVVLITLGIACSSAFSQESGWAVGAKVGTEGIGADLHRQIVPNILNLRIGGSFFPFSRTFSEDDIDYEGELRLAALPVLLDVYPFKNWFRLEGGLMINFNEALGTAVPRQGQIDIGDNTYPADLIGQLKGDVKFNRTSPYFGLGFCNPIKKGKRWGFLFDIGAMYHGQGDVTLTTSTTPPPQLLIDLKREEQNVEDEIRKFTFFPLIQFGVSFHF